MIGRCAPLAALCAALVATLVVVTPLPAQRLEVSRGEVAWIPGGWTVRGSTIEDVEYALALCLLDPSDVIVRPCTPELFADETPAHRVWVSAFGMDRTEVTNEAWRGCVTANACPPPRLSEGDERVARPDHPVAGISWAEAGAFCALRGGRLPTEAEWERAARGDDRRRRFPWGRYHNDRLSNHGRGEHEPDGVDGHRYAAPVGSYPDGASPYGILDLAGNVWEWTADAYEPEWYARLEVRVDPRGPPPSGLRVARGGSWRWAAVYLRSTQRMPFPEGDSQPDVGVRCAYDPPRGVD
jgi:formylglycine-generating enzyme required for sulfatase activity